MALGQHIVEQSALLHWELVRPDHKPHLAVCDPAGRELFDPVTAVGERISRGEHDFIGSLYSAFAASAG
jgi:hypothetical protein